MNFGGFLGDLFHNIGNLIGVGNHPQQPQQPQHPVQQPHNNPVPLPNPMALPQPQRQMAPTPQPIQAPQNHISAMPNTQSNPGAVLQKAPAPAPAPIQASPVRVQSSAPIAAQTPVVNPTSFLSPQTRALKAKSDYENSPLGLIANTAGQVGRTLAGGAVDAVNFATRIPETIQTAGDSAVLLKDKLLHQNNAADLLKASLTQKSYNDTQKMLGNVTNAISGGDTQTNDETNREAQEISSGNYNKGGNLPGDLVSAATKSLGLASSALPIIATAGKTADALNGTRVAVKDTPEVAPGVHSVNPNPKPVEPPMAAPIDATQSAPPVEAPPAPEPAPAPAPAPEPAPAPAPEPAPEPAPQPVEVPPAPAPVTDHTAPNAPNIRAQAQKDLDTASSGLNLDKVKEHEVLTNEQLNTAAHQYVQSMNDAEFKAYAKSAEATTIHTAGDISKAYATVRRLGKMAKNGDKEAGDAIPAILDAVEKTSSEGGRNLNYVGSMLDNMPKEAQQEWLVKSINRAREANGLERLSPSEDDAARKDLEEYLTEIEERKDAVAAAKGKLDQITENPGEHTSLDARDQIKQYEQEIADNQRYINQLNTQVGKSYADISGAKGNWAKSGGEVARSLMLTKVTGRLSDVATTGINGLHRFGQMTGEALLGKAGNALTRTPGKYIDTLPSPKAIFQGTQKGARDMAESYKGNVETPDLYTAIKGGKATGKAQLVTPYTGTAAARGIRHLGHAMAETATNLSEGLGSARIHQLAMQEGKQADYTGAELRAYAAARAANPTQKMQDAGKQLVDEINNMNDNKLARAMSKLSTAVSDGLREVGVNSSAKNAKMFGVSKLTDFAGEQIRNLVAPFTHWAATQAWNGATDKNVVANTLKLANAIRKGDSQETLNQLSGLAVNGPLAIGTGYAMANSGLLTTHNSEGYDDEGLYLHIGGQYIPVSFIGFFAPGVIMGWAAHQAMTDDGPGSMIEKVAKAAGDSFMATVRSDFANTVIGGSNEFIKQFQEMLQNKNGVDGVDVAATGATDAVGSYIPGAFGDVNTAINTFNIGNLNPNHEAGLTKVTKGQSGQLTASGNSASTAKDIPASDGMTLLNKIPVAGQMLVPRKPGVAANNLISSVARGDNESADQAEENKVIDSLPQDQQQGVRTALLKASGAAQDTAQKTADAMPAGPQKVKAQLAADKLVFNSQNGTLQKAVGDAQASADKAAFQKSNKQTATINGKVWANINGSPKQFDNQMAANQALDLQDFKSGKSNFQQKNGMTYVRNSDGKVQAVQTKDYDYSTADKGMSEAKKSGDLSGVQANGQKLLGNISWQLQHATNSQANIESLTNKAMATQSDLNKIQQWGSLTKPKNAPSLDTPQITGAKQYDKPQNGFHGYSDAIAASAAKYGVDINAAMSVAAQEGLGGGVGDGGHAFGPFQMNDAGGVLTGKYKTPEEARAYAESPQGIDDAMKQIAAVVGNKTGDEAVKAIVNGFERPADPDSEIAKALALYHGGSAKVTTDGSSGTTVTPNGSSSASAADLIKQNKVGSLPTLQREDFTTSMQPKEIAAPQRQVKLTAPGELIKARNISVSSRP